MLCVTFGGKQSTFQQGHEYFTVHFETHSASHHFCYFHKWRLLIMFCHFHTLCSFCGSHWAEKDKNLPTTNRKEQTWVCCQLQCEQSPTLWIHRQPDQHSKLWRRLMPNRSMMVPVWPGGHSFWITKSSITTYWGQQTTTHHPSSSPTERQKDCRQRLAEKTLLLIRKDRVSVVHREVNCNWKIQPQAVYQENDSSFTQLMLNITLQKKIQN